MTARTIVLEDPARAYLDDEIAKCKILRDVYRGLEYRISRDPFAGQPVVGFNPIRYMAKSPPYRFPAPQILTLLYHVTTDEVTIEFMRVNP